MFCSWPVGLLGGNFATKTATHTDCGCCRIVGVPCCEGTTEVLRLPRTIRTAAAAVRVVVCLFALFTCFILRREMIKSILITQLVRACFFGGISHGTGFDSRCERFKTKKCMSTNSCSVLDARNVERAHGLWGRIPPPRKDKQHITESFCLYPFCFPLSLMRLTSATTRTENNRPSAPTTARVPPTILIYPRTAFDMVVQDTHARQTRTRRTAPSHSAFLFVSCGCSRQRQPLMVVPV